MIGFHKINSHPKDGFDLLPSHMQINLKSLRPHDPGHNSAFIFYDKNSDLKPSFLMQLRPGGLRHHDEDIDLDGNLKRVCFGFVILHPDFKMEGEGSICPKIFTMHFWVYLSCRVYCQRKVNIPLCCLLHLSQSKERLVSWIVLNKVRQRTKWMANGEMDLMLSILFCDGRYEDLAYGVWQALRSL